MIARLQELEEENRQLKKMYAEERLKSELRKKAFEKKWSTLAAARHGQTGCYTKKDQYPPSLRYLWYQRTWGFGLYFLYLRNVKGFVWNHKRVYRIYRELELNMRIKPKKRLKRDKPVTLAAPSTISETWSMDFMHDQMEDGRCFRLLNILDDCNREGVGY